jgi:hypothetical protein
MLVALSLEGVETLPELGQDVRRLANLAYPTAPNDVRETLTKEQFIDSLIERCGGIKPRRCLIPTCFENRGIWLYRPSTWTYPRVSWPPCFLMYGHGNWGYASPIFADLKFPSFSLYKTIICQVPRKLVRTQCLYTSIQVTRYKLVDSGGICSKLVLYHSKLKWPCQERICSLVVCLSPK